MKVNVNGHSYVVELKKEVSHKGKKKGYKVAISEIVPIAVGTSHCNPIDEFDAEMGQNLALKRALDNAGIRDRKVKLPFFNALKETLKTK